MNMKLTEYIKALQAVSKAVGPDAEIVVYHEDRYVPLSYQFIYELTDEKKLRLESKGGLQVDRREKCIYI